MYDLSTSAPTAIFDAVLPTEANQNILEARSVYMGGGDGAMWKVASAVIGLILAIGATPATAASAARVLASVAAGRPVEMAPETTIILGAATDTVLTRCGAAGLTVGERLQLNAFVRTAVTRAAVGDRYADPSLGRTMSSQMTGAQYYTAAGVMAKQSIACGPSATRFLKTTLRSIEQSRSNGAKSEFVASCSRSFDARRCSCLLEVASTIYPNLASASYDRSLISSVMKANPLIGIQIPMRCGINDY